MPQANWGGWHPDVPMDSIKIKMVDAGAGGTSSDIHKFDLFAEHRYRASRFDNLVTSPITRTMQHVMPADATGASLYRELDRAGFENIRVRQGVGGDDDVRWNLRRGLGDLGAAVGRYLN